MKRERVYVVEIEDRTGTWRPLPGSSANDVVTARVVCRTQIGLGPKSSFRVMPYERVPNARPLLVVKGGSCAK